MRDHLKSEARGLLLPRAHDKARRIILEGRGTQFDPAVVDAFIAREQAFTQLAVELAGKIVQRQLSAEDHDRLIRESLTQFPSEN